MNETTKADEKLNMKVLMPLELDWKRIMDLICEGFEGGIGYWGAIVGYKEPTKLVRTMDEDEVFKHVDYPVNPGGAVLIEVEVSEDSERFGKVFTLDLQKVERGLKVMAEKYPRHFSNWLSENDDAETGDVFIQCCLFGEVVYG